MAVPGGPTDTFTYNGLGLRVGKTDSTGTYSYVCDGTSPGSSILSDGQAVYTPGLSERRNGASLFYNSDDLGNLWTADDSTGQAEAGAYLFTGFGAPLYTGSGAAGASPLKYGGANDCQTDGDTGLVLMGHRYYDTRIGRFINQDPVGDGDNWYAYADNNPTNEVDPTGLAIATGDLFQDPSQAGIAYDPNGNVSSQYIQDNPGECNVYTAGSGGNYQYAGSEWEGATAFDQMNNPMSGGSPAGMIAINTNSMTQARAPNKWWQAVLQGLAAAALHTGHIKHEPVEVPHVIAKKEERGPTEEEKDKEAGGDKYSLHNFEQGMRGLGRWTMEVLGELSAPLNGKSSYGAPVTLGGGAAAWE